MGKLHLLYPFPEPLPLPRARGVQVIHTVHALGAEPLDVTLAYVPDTGNSDPFVHYGLVRPASVGLLPLSRGLPPPLAVFPVQSGRFFLWRLRRWLKSAQRPPHAIFVRHLKLAYALLVQCPGIPIIYEAHEVFADGASSTKAENLARLEKTVLEKAAAVVVITQALGKLLEERYGVRRDMVVIPSATTLPENPPEKDWCAASRNIVYSGSLYGWKGAQDLVAAAEFLPDCTITLVGGERQRIEELQAAAPRNGARLEFAGHVSHAEVQRRLASACIAILPNRAGSVSAFTSPLKLFEYMAAGCAIVTSDLPVFHEVLKPNDAAWFPPGDPQGLAQALRTLTENVSLAEALGRRMGERAKDYSWRARGQRLYGLVEQVVGVGT